MKKLYYSFIITLVGLIALSTVGQISTAQNKSEENTESVNQKSLQKTNLTVIKSSNDFFAQISDSALQNIKFEGITASQTSDESAGKSPFKSVAGDNIPAKPGIYQTTDGELNKNAAGSFIENSQSPVIASNTSSIQREALRVRDMKRLSDTAGWILTGTALLWTSTAGSEWVDITPANEGNGSLLAVQFRDVNNGDVIIGKSIRNGIVLTVMRTGDSGRTWNRLTDINKIDTDQRAYSGDVSLQFVDNDNGWILLKLRSGSNFSHAELLATTNGGSDWTKLPDPPFAGSMTFVSPAAGWLVGGAAGDQIYSAADGGRSWQSQSEKFLPSIPKTASNIVFDRPVFENDLKGKVLVTYVEGDREKLACYATRNGGTSWLQTSLLDIGESEQRRDYLPHSFVSNGNLITSTLTPKEILRVNDNETTLMTNMKENSKELIPLDSPIRKLDFISETDGWVLITVGSCLKFKTECSDRSYLLSTTDGGRSFDDITPAGTGTKPLLSENTEQNFLDPNLAPASVVTLRNVEGFDKCEIPTTSQMQIWWNSSPYYAAAGYIGGANRSCANTGLTSSWITTIVSQGWGFIPIWLGLQATTSSCGGCSKMSTDPTTAENQGVSEANSAADRAAVLGLGSQTIIYYDMESYDRSNSTARNAAKAFINGWVRRMHERGHIGSVYSSHPMFQDWTPGNIANPPDSIWFAWFFQTGVPCGSQCHTVFGVSDISDSLWVNDQRLRQTSSTIDRCYGSVCFTGNGGIDEDWLDGPVVGGGGNSPGSFTMTLTPECSGTSSQIRLNWTASSGASSYDIYRNGSLYASGITGLQYINSANITVGTSYSYFVRAINTAGSTNSNTQSATAPNCAPTPTITTSVASLPGFGNIAVGQNSAPQSYTVSGSNLSGNITIQAPAGFQISLSSTSGFTSTLNLSQSGGSVPTTTIFARFSPQVTGAQTGNISHTSSGAVTTNVSVSGTGSGTTCPSPSPIIIGQTINGSLQSGDCTYTDGSYYDAYTFNGTAGQQIYITLNSTQFNAYLLLYQGSYPGGTLTAQDNDGNGGTNARIPATSGFLTLTATGTYTILANSLAAGETGSYSLFLGSGSGGTIQFSSATYSVNENSGSVTINVTRTGGTSAVGVNYATSNGTATAGADYTATSGTLSFAVNETNKTFTIPIIDDTLIEGNETVNLTLSNPTGGATLGSPSTAVLTIIDNESPCTYSISSAENSVGPGTGSTNFLMNAPSGCAWTATSDSPSWLTTSSSGSGNGTISYSYTANTSPSTRIGRITAGGQVHTVTQIGVGGGGSVQFSSADYSVNEGAGTATITVTRTGGTASGSVQYSTSNGSATAGIDYQSASGTLFFFDNETSKTFTVTILDDTIFEGNETINLTLSGTSPSFTLGNPSTATLTIIDNENPPSTSRRFDFDGDGKTDISIFRPSNGQWWINRSSTGQSFAATFGLSTDQITPGDFTGDGKTDIAFFRPSTGTWYVLRSEDFSFYAFPFGLSTDIPAPGDFDGDGKYDAAVFRPSTGTWYISRSSGGTTIQQFGINSDVPVAADYDGDGKTDIAIYRPSNGQWWLQRSALGIIAFQFGNSSDKSVPGDYTGDGKADVAIFRPSSGEWYILRSENQSFYAFPFGLGADLPVPGDYDGDGKFDAAVFRPSNSTWYVQQSAAGTLIQSFGQSGDKPVPNAFVP